MYDRALVLRARDGDQEAFRSLYDAGATPILGLLRGLCAGDRGRAEEALEETFVRAFASLGQLDVNRPFEPWIEEIARNVVRERLGKAPVEQGRCLDADQLSAFEGGLLDEVARAAALAHLEACPPCRGLRSRLVRSLEELRELPGELVVPEAATWERVRARLARPVVAPAPEVSVGCSYCKGRLVRADAVYCAGCLAPHHQDCWSDHGKCAACAADILVRAERSPKGRHGVVAAALALGVGLGVAALAPWRIAVSEAPRPILPDQGSRAPLPPDPPRAPDSASVSAPRTPEGTSSSGVAVGDTVRVRGSRGRVVRLVPEGFVLCPWTGDGWGEEVTVSSDTLYAPVELEKMSTFDSAGGRAALTVGFFKQGASCRVSLLVSLAGKDRILRSARLMVPNRRPIELGPMLPGDTRTESLGIDLGGPAGALTDVDIVPVASPEGKRIIARLLANDAVLYQQLAEAAVTNGDSQLALALAHRLDGEDWKIVDRVFAGFEGPGADALLEHLAVDSNHYGVMTPTEEGTLVWKPTGKPSTVQRREVELLDDLSFALQGGRAFVLFQLTRGRTAARDELLDVARNHVEDLIDAMATDPRFVEDDNLDAAVAFFVGLGDGACSALAARVTPLDDEMAQAITSRKTFDVEPVKKGLARIREDLSSTHRKP